eukprot:TRINITY_DN6021_c0_g1_i1.p1 TRINITY_DN6021_c0_g1~~TRINITY_DN6021_c0_g1_i1.p1  ORF type:complete len:431 (+),score=107.76 TRINITY_DN6021_c0_g1_i1:40-1332(+)
MSSQNELIRSLNNHGSSLSLPNSSDVSRSLRHPNFNAQNESMNHSRASTNTPSYPLLFNPINNTTQLNNPGGNFPRAAPVGHSLPFEGHVFYLDIPPDEKVKKFADLLVTYGGKVEDKFDPQIMTHLVINPSHKEIQALATAKRNKKALDLASKAASNETSSIVEVCTNMGKQIVHVNSLVKKMKEIQASKKKAVASVKKEAPKNPIPLFQPHQYVANQQQQQFPNHLLASNNHNSHVASNNFHQQLFSAQTANPNAKRRKVEPQSISNALPNFMLQHTSSSFFNNPRMGPNTGVKPNLLTVEDMLTNCKPLVKSFSLDKRGPMSFPGLNLESPYPLISPFFSQEEAVVSWKKKLERDKEAADKEKLEGKEGKFLAQPLKKEGWCECCSTKYDDLEQHVLTPKHVSFANNSANYKEIDEFIMNNSGLSQT